MIQLALITGLNKVVVRLERFMWLNAILNFDSQSDCDELANRLS